LLLEVDTGVLLLKPDDDEMSSSDAAYRIVEKLEKRYEV
jgi:hypothetical protein